MLSTLIASALISAAMPQQTDTTFAVASGARLDIDAFRGEVVIRTWDRNEMRVVAFHSSRTRVGISQSSSVVRIRPQAYQGVANVDVELTVPAGTDVDVNGTFMGADISGDFGEVRVETVQGDINATGATGFAYLYSVQGDVTLSNASGDLTVHSVHGSLGVDGAMGKLTADATHGNITLHGIESSQVEATTVSGTVRFEGTIEDGGRYRLSTHSGNVIVTVPENINAAISVSTFSGSFDAGFPITLTETWSQGRQFSFTIGDGSARIDLESFSGDIDLRRR
ncbi:MAG: DUF4097 family beta strand repeat protein [Gemmatimonadota bacterium]|nr:MAG: DUF4097 family beta strand repeat protein [Gemmatimonadota bacterium]